ncbi:MAG: Uma2 family endonuclease [Chloroflexi bacterium]|nr:Uma2 family endonuclease [Chloroflexota bacterium]
MSAVVERHLWSADEYERLAQFGFFDEDDRVELIRGEIVAISPIGDRHSGCVNALNELLRDRLGKSVIIAVQNPVRLNNASEPQPDVGVLRRRADFYRKGHPIPADVILLIEVSDSTADYDEQVKIPLYAEAAIPEVWIVDLKFGIVSQFADPLFGKYRHLTRGRTGDTVTARTVPNLTLTVDEILGDG